MEMDVRAHACSRMRFNMDRHIKTNVDRWGDTI